jgi:tetratricopeptide (TPR) repeat protein
MEERSYQDLYNALNHCEEDSDKAFEIYKEMMPICEDGIKSFRDDLEDDGTRGFMPIDVDSYAAPMDNLSRIYMKRGEYAKALHLLEQVLPMYRILETYNTNYTYHRCNALEAMAECLDKLGKNDMATLYYYELKHLQLEVLKVRENSKENT